MTRVLHEGLLLDLFVSAAISIPAISISRSNSWPHNHFEFWTLSRPAIGQSAWEMRLPRAHSAASKHSKFPPPPSSDLRRQAAPRRQLTLRADMHTLRRAPLTPQLVFAPLAVPAPLAPCQSDIVALSLCPVPIVVR